MEAIVVDVLETEGENYNTTHSTSSFLLQGNRADIGWTKSSDVTEQVTLAFCDTVSHISATKLNNTF